MDASSLGGVVTDSGSESSGLDSNNLLDRKVCSQFVASAVPADLELCLFFFCPLTKFLSFHVRVISGPSNPFLLCHLDPS